MASLTRPGKVSIGIRRVHLIVPRTSFSISSILKPCWRIISGASMLRLVLKITARHSMMFSNRDENNYVEMTESRRESSFTRSFSVTTSQVEIL